MTQTQWLLVSRYGWPVAFRNFPVALSWVVLRAGLTISETASTKESTTACAFLRSLDST